MAIAFIHTINQRMPAQFPFFSSATSPSCARTLLWTPHQSHAILESNELSVMANAWNGDIGYCTHKETTEVAEAGKAGMRRWDAKVNMDFGGGIVGAALHDGCCTEHDCCTFVRRLSPWRQIEVRCALRRAEESQVACF